MWSVKHTWAERNYDSNGLIVNMGCKICVIFNKGLQFVQCKIDTLSKCVERRTAEHDMPKYGVKNGEIFDTQNTKNKNIIILFNRRQPIKILQQVINRDERDGKKVQFATFFYILEGVCQ